MAKTEANANVKPSFFKRIGNWFSNCFKGVGRFFMNMKHEMKKVTWPTKKDMVNYSLVVFAFVVVMLVIIGVFDLGASSLMSWLVNL